MEPTSSWQRRREFGYSEPRGLLADVRPILLTASRVMLLMDSRQRTGWILLQHGE